MQLSLELILAYSLISLSLLINLFLIFWLYRLRHHYNSLTAGVDKRNLLQSLEGIQKTLSEHERASLSLKQSLLQLQEDAHLHLQNLTLKRFNPFGDTGGDQSFILALLDGNSDGVMITSLHSRENTRFYVKSIKGGVGIEHPLSTEEQKLIKRKAK